MTQRKGYRYSSVSFLKEIYSTCVAGFYEKAAVENGKENKTWALEELPRWEITNLLWY